MTGLEKVDKTLELDGEAMQKMVDEAMVQIVRFIQELPCQPAARVDSGEEAARSVMEPLPEDPEPYQQLLQKLFQDLIPISFNTAGPGYLAYIPGGGLFHSAVADLISNAVNRYVGVWRAAPGLAQLEATVVRWFCSIVGYGDQSLGFLTSGGSLANWAALVAARSERLGEDFHSGCIYMSDQTHHSLQKAALMTGLRRRQIRIIASDSHFRIRLDLLEDTIQKDRKAGLVPFLLVGNAGTTNTGAVDDLAGLADLSAREKLWFHVDAAYGGFFMLTQQGHQLMHSMSQAHSIVLDPHKGLFLPYGTGCLLVRDAACLKRTYQADAHYLPAMQEDADFVDFCEISPELSRNFRGLRVWLPFKMHGISPFRKNLEEKIALTRWAADQLRQIPGIELVAEPQLSILAFRFNPGGRSSQELNRLNRDLLTHINRPGRVYLTPTLLGNRFVIRICVLSFRTHLERMQMAVEDIRRGVDLLSAPSRNPEPSGASSS